jgi:hypothetical protein
MSGWQTLCNAKSGDSARDSTEQCKEIGETHRLALLQYHTANDGTQNAAANLSPKPKYHQQKLIQRRLVSLLPHNGANSLAENEQEYDFEHGSLAMEKWAWQEVYALNQARSRKMAYRP